MLVAAADGVQFVDQVIGNVPSKWEIFRDTQADGPQRRVLECPKGVSLVKKRLIEIPSCALCFASAALTVHGLASCAVFAVADERLADEGPVPKVRARKVSPGCGAVAHHQRD